MSALKIITTADGSHSLLNEELNETYHSVHGAVQESRHVFINNGLEHFIQKSGQDCISILEIGFGTGLNAFLTLQYSQEKTSLVQYTTLEAYPLSEEVYQELNYPGSLSDKEYFLNLHRADWATSQRILPHFQLVKLHTTLQEVSLMPTSFDLVYFDAFAPNKQPELWTAPMLEKVIGAMKDGGVFVTYCAKGQLKRDLKSLGLVVETLPGPPGKKEMVRATKSLSLPV